MKVAILGTGSIGMQHAQLLKSIGHTAILIPVRNSRRQTLQGDGWLVAESICQAADQGISFCVIATNSDRHVDDVIEAYRCGFKVLVEKPLSLSVSDARRLEEALSNEELNSLRVACVMRFHSGIAELQSRLASMGRLHTVRIECQSYLPDWRPQQDYTQSYSACPHQGGVLRDLVHEIDYCNMLFSLPKVDAVSCSVVTGLKTLGIEATSNTILHWQKAGCIVSIQLDYLTRRSRRAVSVFGEHGELYLDFIGGKLVERKFGEEQVVEIDSDRVKAHTLMWESFLSQDEGGCDYRAAIEVAELIDFCENSVEKIKE